MKKIIILALFIASSAFAQNAKVLICSPGDPVSAQATLASLQKVYHDSIDVSDTITDAVNNYEAVFLQVSYRRPLNSGGTVIKKYLHENKKLFVRLEGQYAFGDDVMDSNGFSNFIHFTGELFEDVEEPIDGVIGKNETFTKGLNITKINTFASSIPYIECASTPVLYAISLHSIPYDTFSIANIYETDSFKIVLYYPTLSYDDKEFLARVICNYFELCTPLSVKQSEVRSISLYPNPATDVLHISNKSENSLQSAELISLDGSIISKFSLNSDQAEIDLGSLNLSSGNYFLRLQMPKETWTERLILLSK
jgi:hypothetical protein